MHLGRLEGRHGRKELLVAHLADNVVVGLLEHREVAEGERPKVVVWRRLRIGALATRLARGRGGGSECSRRGLEARRRLGVRWSRCCLNLELLGRFIVGEDLVGRRSSGVKVVGVLGVCNLGHKVDLAAEEVVPIDAVEKGMRLDLGGSVGAQSSLGVRAEQSLHKVASLGREVDFLVVPFDTARQDVLEHLLGRFVVEWREAVQEPAKESLARGSAEMKAMRTRSR